MERKGLERKTAIKRGTLKSMTEGEEKDEVQQAEKQKASIRARVEHPFGVIKRQFGLLKVRFSGLAKNTSHIVTLFALSNLWMARKRLLALTGEVRPQFG